jgi:hypothetical protein
MLKFFLPRRDFTWAQLDKMTHKLPGKGTTWFPALPEIQKLGVKTILIEAFDYSIFYNRGNDYIYGQYWEEVGNWYLNNSNLLEVKPLIRLFLKVSAYDHRPATLMGVDRLL